MENLTDKEVMHIKSAFKAYDVRGRVPIELNEKIVQRIGNAFIKFLGSIRRPVIVGHDIRLTSESFADFLIRGITDAGIDVINIGLVSTDMVYFATAKYNCAGGICITASHNPSNYNGIKFVREKAFPISADTGLNKIRDYVVSNTYINNDHKGKIKNINIMDDYINHILSFIDIEKIKPLKVVMNAGNGCVGIILSELMKRIPVIDTVPQYWEPDGTFPNGIPNPLLPERREATSRKVIESKADLGVAWDGDGDRCFFYDNEGNFIDGYYLVALFGEFFSKKYPNAKIIHDPRLVWATKEAVISNGGIPIEHKAGHTFIKERMRKEDAIYAGEMSAHHYFRDNWYADNGMIPMLLLFQILGESNKTLNKLVKGWIDRYPISGEINIHVKDQRQVLKTIENEYKEQALTISYTDGVSLEFDKWRFNLRSSNTEPVIRLNIETKGDYDLLKVKITELTTRIKQIE